LAVLGCHTATQAKGVLKKAKRILNAGCGVAWSEYLFNYNPQAERHGVDLSLSVEVAYRHTHNISNMVISQGSVFDLPYRDKMFDIIFSVGVLHHTPDPSGALRALSRKLAPGGLIGVYIYNKKPFLRELADEKIRKITTRLSYQECMKFSKEISQFGKALSRIHQPLKIKKDIELLGIKKGTYSLQRFVYDHIVKCWYNPNTDDGYADVVNQDWYHPFYASHHSKDEVVSWFKKAGCKRIKILQPKGWEHSGYFVSGRKL